MQALGVGEPYAFPAIVGQDAAAAPLPPAALLRTRLRPGGGSPCTQMIVSGGMDSASCPPYPRFPDSASCPPALRAAAGQCTTTPGADGAADAAVDAAAGGTIHDSLLDGRSLPPGVSPAATPPAGIINFETLNTLRTFFGPSMHTINKGVSPAGAVIDRRDSIPSTINDADGVEQPANAADEQAGNAASAATAAILATSTASMVTPGERTVAKPKDQEDQEQVPESDGAQQRQQTVPPPPSAAPIVIRREEEPSPSPIPDEAAPASDDPKPAAPERDCAERESAARESVEEREEVHSPTEEEHDSTTASPTSAVPTHAHPEPEPNDPDDGPLGDDPDSESGGKEETLEETEETRVFSLHARLLIERESFHYKTDIVERESYSKIAFEDGQKKPGDITTSIDGQQLFRIQARLYRVEKDLDSGSDDVPLDTSSKCCESLDLNWDLPVKLGPKPSSSVFQQQHNNNRRNAEYPPGFSAAAQQQQLAAPQQQPPTAVALAKAKPFSPSNPDMRGITAVISDPAVAMISLPSRYL